MLVTEPAQKGLSKADGSLTSAQIGCSFAHSHSEVKEVKDPSAPSKHLWEYKNRDLTEVELNHAYPKTFESWQEFLRIGAFNCNCTFERPLLWWYWEVPFNQQDDRWSYGHEPSPDDGGKCDACLTPDDKSDLLNLIYAEWSSGVTRFCIRIKREEEDSIRQFIREAKRSFQFEEQ